MVNGLVARTKDNSIVDADQEDDGPSVVETRVKLTWFEPDLSHPLVHKLIPHTPGLFLAIYVVKKFERACFPGDPVAFVALWKPHVEWHFRWILGIGHDEVELSALPAKQDGKDKEKVDGLPLYFWGVGVPVVNTMVLLPSDTIPTENG